MQILYMLYKLCASCIQNFATTASEVAGELLPSFDLLNKKKFNDCRTRIFVDVMNTSLAQLRTGDMLGSEQSFLDKICFLVACLQYRICQSSSSPLPQASNGYPSKDQRKKYIYDGKNEDNYLEFSPAAKWHKLSTVWCVLVA